MTVVMQCITSLVMAQGLMLTFSNWLTSKV